MRYNNESYATAKLFENRSPDPIRMISVKFGEKKQNQLESSNENIAKFVQSTVHFLRNHNFSGIHLNWAKPNIFMAEELKKAFKPHEYLLSAVGTDSLNGNRSPYLLYQFDIYHNTYFNKQYHIILFVDWMKFWILSSCGPSVYTNLT